MISDVVISTVPRHASWELVTWHQNQSKFKSVLFISGDEVYQLGYFNSTPVSKS